MADRSDRQKVFAAFLTLRKRHGAATALRGCCQKCVKKRLLDASPDAPFLAHVNDQTVQPRGHPAGYRGDHPADRRGVRRAGLGRRVARAGPRDRRARQAAAGRAGALKTRRLR
jgi:hypothetical protein